MMNLQISFYYNCFSFFPDMNRAVELFGQLQKVDPFRLENMDIYSDLLYVKVGQSVFSQDIRPYLLRHGYNQCCG